MSGESIQVGQYFTVTCNVLPLSNLQDYSGHEIHYRRPDGRTGFITPDSATGATAIGTITNLINPQSGRPGTWKFYLHIASGSVVFKSKVATLVVHPLF